MARKAINAIGKVSLNHLDSLFLEQFAKAGNRIHADLPGTAEFNGLFVDLVFACDAVVATLLNPARIGRNVEDVFDRQVALQVVDQDRFGLGARESWVARMSRRYRRTRMKFGRAVAALRQD